MSKGKCKLEIGKFYNIYGGKTHPALVYERTKLNTYKSIKFGTTKAKHTTEILPIQKGIEKTFVHNRPFEGTRKDYGPRELEGLDLNTVDLKLIEEIKNRQTNKTKRAKRRY